MRDVLMIDLSSNNSPPNLPAHFHAGRRLIGLKATEGTGYTWTAGLKLGDEWHRLGGRVVWYHFATADSTGAAQAEHFLATVRRHLHRGGDVLALDVEPQPASYEQWRPHQAGRLAEAFAAVIDKRAPRRRWFRRRMRRWVYGPPYFLRDEHIKPARGWGLWVADYAAVVGLIPPGWRRYAAWQYTDRASSVPGVRGLVDQSKVRPRSVSRLVRKGRAR